MKKAADDYRRTVENEWLTASMLRIELALIERVCAEFLDHEDVRLGDKRIGKGYNLATR